MTWPKDVNDLVERYLWAVREELPRRLAEDVTRELRTLIEDKLADRAQALGTPVDLRATLPAATILHRSTWWVRASIRRSSSC
jgi:hypothetical protein